VVVVSSSPGPGIKRITWLGLAAGVGVASLAPCAATDGPGGDAVGSALLVGPTTGRGTATGDSMMPLVGAGAFTWPIAMLMAAMMSTRTIPPMTAATPAMTLPR